MKILRIKKEGDIAIMQTRTMAILVLVLLGLYFLAVHTAPLPLNHEAIGLGTNHIAHRVFGIILLAVAGYLWKSKGTQKQS